MSREKGSLGFLTRSDTNWPEKPRNKARSLELKIYEQEGLYYPCSGNKDVDQLCSYCTADLHLCCCIGKGQFSHHMANLVLKYFLQLIHSKSLTLCTFLLLCIIKTLFQYCNECCTFYSRKDLKCILSYSPTTVEIAESATFIRAPPS